MLGSTGLDISPLGMPLSLLSTCTLSCYHSSFRATIQSIPYPLSGASVKFVSLQFSDKDDVMWDSVKGFAHVPENLAEKGFHLPLQNFWVGVVTLQAALPCLDLSL